MARARTTSGTEPWKDFIVRNGWRAAGHELAKVLGRTEAEVAAVRQTGACVRLDKALKFSALFSLWHGRPPVDADWPAPRHAGSGSGSYEWQGREDALLASLVGQLSVPQIAAALTQRLRQVTGDAKAHRGINPVHLRINRVGLWARDLVGGITVQNAGREINSVSTVYGAIDKGQLTPRRIGKRLLIARDQWTAWKAGRTFPPAGYVSLASLREDLGIRSDSKLSEFARMGYVPTAVPCNPYGMGTGTMYGTWFIDAKVAKKLLSDRRAGRAMPWHKQPMLDNLKATWKRLQDRLHPSSCETCAEIWGPAGAPRDFDDYLKRYPPLEHGAKRHLTRIYSPGLTLDEVAKLAKRPRAEVQRAVRNGLLRASMVKRRRYVTRTDATRWLARKCPSGDGRASWVSIETACKRYHFTPRELRALIKDGTLRSKLGTEGAMRGITYVLRQQCAQLREAEGFTEQEAAKRLRITVKRLQHLLQGVEWRPAPLIPLVTLQAVRKRLDSRAGFDIDEAAAELGQPTQWVKDVGAD
jgi:hypothetical protein